MSIPEAIFGSVIGICVAAVLIVAIIAINKW